MSNRTKLITLLNTSLSVPVYSDFVPESVTDPAVAINNVSNPFSRVIEGTKYGRSGIWRVTVVAKSTSDVESIIEELEALDNARNTDFQKIQVWHVNTESKEPNQTYRRAFVDVQVYN